MLAGWELAWRRYHFSGVGRHLDSVMSLHCL